MHNIHLAIRQERFNDAGKISFEYMTVFIYILHICKYYVHNLLLSASLNTQILAVSWNNLSPKLVC